MEVFLFIGCGVGYFPVHEGFNEVIGIGIEGGSVR